MQAMRVVWQSGEGETTQIGCVNQHDQECRGTLKVKGTDHEQYAYKVECLRCGYVYGANGSDLHERKCPNCQEGAAGIRYWF